MQKILYLITQSEKGGAQTYVFDLARKLKNEFEISVAFGEQGEQGEVAGWLKKENIPYFVIPHLKRNISPLNDLLAIFEIRKLIKKINPNIIHLNSSKISILGSLAMPFIRSIRIPDNQTLTEKTIRTPFIRSIRIPDNQTLTEKTIRIIYTAHGWVFNEPMNKLKKLFYIYAEKFTARFKDKIICVSEFDRLTAIENKIAPEKKLITIHNGIDKIEFYSKEEAREKIFETTDRHLSAGRQGRQTTGMIIGSIGNLYPTKGYEYLIKAAPVVCGLSSVVFVIIGEGPERPKLEKLIKDLKLEDKVFLPGREGFSARVMPAFDIYVSSSVKEGLSYTIMEAMQAGLPIIATRVGGSPELIQDNKNGLLVNPKSPEQIAEAIVRLQTADYRPLDSAQGRQQTSRLGSGQTTDPSTRLRADNRSLKDELAENAKIASQNFTLDKMVEKTKKLY